MEELGTAYALTIIAVLCLHLSWAIDCFLPEERLP